jgi:hypothetical protein
MKEQTPTATESHTAELIFLPLQGTEKRFDTLALKDAAIDRIENESRRLHKIMDDMFAQLDGEHAKSLYNIEARIWLFKRFLDGPDFETSRLGPCLKTLTVKMEKGVWGDDKKIRTADYNGVVRWLEEGRTIIKILKDELSQAKNSKKDGGV